MFFETARLLIRELIPDDFISFCEMQENPNVMKYITGRAKTSEENISEFEKIQTSYKDTRNQFLVMAVVHKEYNLLLGTCAIVENEIGYRLLERHWGKGFGKELLAGLIEYCFCQKGMDEIYALVDSENIGSVKLLEHSKMRFLKECKDEDTGILEKHYWLCRSDYLNSIAVTGQK